MQSPAETIQRIREYIFDNSLDLHIRYLLVTNEAHPSEYARYNLHRMLHARRLSVLVFKGAVNRALGEASPYANDPELIGRDYHQDHEDWVEFRILRNPPRKRRAETGNRYRNQNTGKSGVASAKAVRKANAPQVAHAATEEATGSVPQPARGSCNENGIMRRTSTSSVEPSEGCAATNPSGAPRREGCEGREGHNPPMSACWPNAERMSELAHRVDEAYAESMRLARVFKATTSQAPEPTAPRPEPVAESAMEHSPSRRLTPLQQVALAAIGNWLLVAGHCGSTKLTAGGSSKLTTGGSTPGSAAVPTSPRLRRTRPAALRTGGPRSYYYAGPGGACPRAAA